MPINKLRATPRATGAIAAIVAISVAGYATVFGYRVHDDVALAVTAVTQPWEGRSLHAYLDTLPKKPVWTICDGDTNNVRAGMVETPEGCNKRLMTKMESDYRPPLVKCIVSWDTQPLSWRAMMIDLAWNIGTGGACGSSAAHIINEATSAKQKPDYIASCNAATAFNKAGGRILIGLVNRREMGDSNRIGEGELCVSGLADAAQPSKTAPTPETSQIPAKPPVSPASPASARGAGIAGYWHQVTHWIGSFF